MPECANRKFRILGAGVLTWRRELVLGPGVVMRPQDPEKPDLTSPIPRVPRRMASE